MHQESLFFFNREENGEDSYLMEVGGSSDVGAYGYLEGFKELTDQVFMCLYQTVDKIT